MALMCAVALAGCEPSGNQGDAADSEAHAARADSTSRTPEAARPAAPETARRASLPIGDGFDFYVLALSWSPSYCEAEGADANRQQCGAARPYAFIVHGLWPQFERGFPSDCGADGPTVPNETLRKLYDIMPSAGLIRHEWQAHGACSGLGQADYFRVLRAARDKVAIPEDFRRPAAYRTLTPTEAETAFMEANPELPPDAISVDCDERYLREVRICLTKDLEFRACDELDRRGCRLPKVVMPPVRGG